MVLYLFVGIFACQNEKAMNRIFLLLCTAMFCNVATAAVEPDELSTEKDSVSMSVGIEQVTVRSFKQNRMLDDVPASISYVPISEITHRNITNIKNFTSVVPNLFMPDFGSRLTSPVFIRGIGSKLNSPSVGLYVDGMPFYDKATFDFDMSEVQSVEVLRGPQGTLYGRNSMGGIINVYTKQPLDYKGTRTKRTVGSYKDMGYNLSHYGRFSDKIGYGISGKYGHKGGYFINQYNGKRIGIEDTGSGSLKLRFRPDDKWDISLVGTYEYTDQGGYPYAPYVDGHIGEVNYNSYSYYKRSLANAGMTLHRSGRKADFFGVLSYQYFKDEQGLDQDFSPANDYYATQKQKQNLASFDFQIKSPESDRRYSWLVGVAGFVQLLDKNVGVEMRDAALAQGLPSYATQAMTYDTPSYGIAAYHQSTIDNLFTDGLSLVLGVRYDFEHSKMDYAMDMSIGNHTTPVSSFSHKLSFSQFMPKVSLQYEMGNNSLVYATVAEGYKPGGFNVSFDTEDEHSYGPEHSLNYEVGTRATCHDGLLTSSLALFYIDWKNQQIQQTIASGLGTKLVNAGRSYSWGAEASLGIHPLRNLNFKFDWGLTQAKFKRYEVSEGLDYNGNRIPFVPQHTFSAAADWGMTFNKLLLDRMVISAQYNGAGAIYWDDKNSVRQPFYGTLDARVSLQKWFIQIDVWGRNMTNTSYMAYYFEALGRQLAQKGTPACFGVDIIFNFNQLKRNKRGGDAA